MNEEGYSLLRKRLTTQVFPRRLYPEASAEYAICSKGEEDHVYLFSECPFNMMIWNHQSTLLVERNSEVSFWRGGCRKEEGHILPVPWAIRLHMNDVLLSGRVASMDGVAYSVEDLAAA